MAEIRMILASAVVLFFATWSTVSSQSCPVRGQSRLDCALPSSCQKTCATANIFINCIALCDINGCQCPSETLINEETDACVKPVGCAKLRCGLPLNTGECAPSVNASSVTRYFFNDSSAECEAFEFEGCDSNGNNFDNLQECQNLCRCVLPSDSGPCEAYFEMYFYNVTSARCEMFVYGGCQGNDNRFATMELCQQACHGDVPPAGGSTDVPPGGGSTDVPPGGGSTDVPPGDGSTDVPPGDGGTDVPLGGGGTDVKFQWWTLSSLLLSAVLMMAALM